MSRTTVIIATISALCLGSALGFACGVLFSHHAMSAYSRMGGRGFRGEGFRRGPPGEPSSRFIVPRLQHMLNLTPEQADAISKEVDASRADFAQVRDSLHARSDRHLTQAQRDRWHEMLKEHPPGEPRGHDPHRAEPGKEGEESR